MDNNGRYVRLRNFVIMNHLKKLSRSLVLSAFALVFLVNGMLLVSFMLLRTRVNLSDEWLLIVLAPVSALMSLVVATVLIDTSLKPIKALWQAVWHISPGKDNVPAPDMSKVKQGRELVDSLMRQIYELASPSSMAAAAPSIPNKAVASEATGKLQPPTLSAEAILDSLPVPIFALDSTLRIVFINNAMTLFTTLQPEDLLGKVLDDVLPLSFSGTTTLENWLKDVRGNHATASSSWDRVRLQLPENTGNKQFDLIAQFTKGGSSGFETLLAMFDHSDKYSGEDNSTGYVSMAVHELRTPLTLLRGYIEVFEDELDQQLTPELRDFMHKMSASAQTLTAFVSNILNVARVDENAMELSLHEANWNELLPQICKDLELRVHVRNKVLELDIDPNLPTVAVDKISIYEVMSNLIENAVKYGMDSEKIIIHARKSKDGTIETVVQDFGIGIPPSAVKNLFTKFYRSHRSKGKVSGSGLGLYLVKAIVGAHGGSVWVQSKDGEGSSFGFTLLPYASVASDQKDPTTGGIERDAHGWIKNHSMYRKQ